MEQGIDGIRTASSETMRLAMGHYQAGRVEEARALAQDRLKQNPADAAALVLLARLARDQGRHDEALGLLGRLAQATGDAPEVLLLIAQTLMSQGALDQALTYCRRAAEGHPPLSAAHHTMGLILGKQQRPIEAMDCYRRAIRQDPKHLPSYVNLAVLLEQANRSGEAAQVATAGLARWPEQPDLNLIAAKLERRDGRPADGLARLWALDRPELPPAQRARLQYEMGACADRAGDAAEAFGHFTTANQLVAESAPPALLQAGADISQIDRLARQFSPQWVATFTPPIAPRDAVGNDPVFLVGFPRSGTTLLDNILDSHPDIATMEERPFSAELVKMVAATERGFPLGIAGMTTEQINQGRELYWHLAHRAFGPQPGRLVVDKLPLNTIAVGTLWRFFPRAKFILALRHPMDACLSCFMQNFTLEPLMVNFLDIGRTAELYAKVMNLWFTYDQVLDLDSRTVRYEDVVSDFEPTVRGLLEFLGVGWDPAVLRYHDTAMSKARISTPSYHQVSQPIYDHARFRFKRYQEQLAPIRPTLDPFIQRFGYGPVPGPA